MVLSKELAHKDSNLEMTESESVALPFGDGPMCFMSLNKWYYTWNPYKCQPIFSNFFKKTQLLYQLVHIRRFSPIPNLLIRWSVL